LKYLHRDVVSASQRERLLQPEMTFVSRFSLDKDRSKSPARSDVLDHRFVDRFFELKQVSKNLVRQFRGKFAEDLVALHVDRHERLIARPPQVERFF
jgi:hypothetical protein